MSIEVRAYRRSDRGACAGIFERAWAHAFPFIPREIDGAIFDAETKDETILVAQDNRALTGFASVYTPDDFLHHLYIDPDFHGRGAGRALVNAALTMAKRPISLKCALGNTRALTFYAHLGFSEGERGADQYGPWVLLSAPAL